jgi:hypothetical protein
METVNLEKGYSMKIFYSLLVVLITSNSLAQSFRPFQYQRPVYYNFSYNEGIFYTQAGIFVDSFKISGSDTIFYHSRIIDYDNSIQGCYIKAHDTSFVGDHSIRLANSDDKFFNRDGDTIYFNNSSSLNDSWIMLKMDDGNTIMATVQSIAAEFVLGVQDSIRIISLQAKDNLGNNLSNQFNNKIFKIGKSFGLVSGYSLFHFPMDTIAFSIAGIENPSVGLTNIKASEIFDFNVGDEFHHYGVNIGFPCCYSEHCSKKVVLSKYISGDTLQYEIAYEYHSFSLNMFGDSTIYSFVVTSTEMYVLNNCGYSFCVGYLDSLPYQANTSYDSYSVLKPGDFFSVSKAKWYESNWVEDSPEDCYSQLLATYYPEKTFAMGLGQVATYEYMDGWGTFYDSLVYYKKNAVEWGTPIACVSGTNIENTVTVKNKFLLFPNPTNSQLMVSGNFNPSQVQFRLLNYLGEEVHLNQVSNQSGYAVFDVSYLEAGIYLLLIESSSESVIQKFFKN